MTNARGVEIAPMPTDPAVLPADAPRAVKKTDAELAYEAYTARVRAEAWRRYTAALPCPSCGGTLTVVFDGQVGVRETGDDRWALEDAPFVACSSCEYCARLTGKER